MKSPRSLVFGQLAFIALIVVQTSWLTAQEVTIKREAISIQDPKGYQVPVRTTPAKLLEIVAPADGIIRQVMVKAGSKVMSQSEACRLDDEAAKLVVDRAKANLAAAKIEVKMALAKKEADLEELAGARVTAAEADLKLAEMQLEKASVKIPFAGELQRVEVIPGQFVRAGERLMTLADNSSMLIEVPVDRSQVKVGSELEVSIEKNNVKGKIQVLLPANASFEPLRGMVHNLATAVIQVDNSKGDFFAGQSVFTKVIPQQPFGSIPTVALQNHAEGARKVQVLRQGVVRDIPVQELTQVGPDRLFVAGAFSPDDEVIVTSSQALKDGQMIRQRTVATAKPEDENAATAAANPATPGAAKPAVPNAQPKGNKPPAF